MNVYSKKKQQPVNVRGKNKDKKSDDEVPSFVNKTSKHQLKKAKKVEIRLISNYDDYSN